MQWCDQQDSNTSRVSRSQNFSGSPHHKTLLSLRCFRCVRGRCVRRDTWRRPQGSTLPRGPPPPSPPASGERPPAETADLIATLRPRIHQVGSGQPACHFILAKPSLGGPQYNQGGTNGNNLVTCDCTICSCVDVWAASHVPHATKRKVLFTENHNFVPIHLQTLGTELQNTSIFG